MKKTLFFIFLLICLAQETFAKGSADYTFEISFESLSFLLNRSDYDTNEQETLNASFEFKYDNYKNFVLFLKPRVRIDFLESNRNRYIPNESYFKFYGDNFEVSAGLQVRPLGISNSYNPTDVLNRNDLGDNFFTPEKLGDVIVSYQYTWPSLGFLDNVTFEVLALPYFQETPLPNNNERFAVAGTVSGFSFTKFDTQDQPDFLKSVGGAFRLASTIRTTDVELLFYHGPERQPSFFLLIDDNTNLRAVPFYYTVDVIGLNTATSLGAFVFHGEAAFKITQLNDPQNHAIPIYTSDVIPNDYLQFVVGFDYTLDGLFGAGGTLVLTAEYLGEDDHSNIFEEFRPFKNDVFVGFRYEFNNLKVTRFQAGVVKDLNNQEMIVQYEFHTGLVKNLEFDVEGVILNQDSDPEAPLSFFENNTYVLGKLTYSFGGSF